MYRVPKILAIATLLGGSAAGCVTSVTGPGNGDDSSTGDDTAGDDTSGDDTTTPPVDEWQDLLDQRTPNYGAALRTASLRLVGQLPTKTEIDAVVAGGKAAYDTQITAYLADPRFAKQMLAFWRDTFKMGGTAEMDTAPAFAAQLAVEGRSYTELLTATTGNCPTVSANGTFTAADCQSGAPANAGVLTNPGVMKQFASNLAFRRTRWVQDIFDCTAFPAEVVAPTDIDGAKYTAPWSFESIAGTANGGRIDFLDTQGVVCANCHETMNHIAPLFANFNDTGQYQAQIAVLTPLDGNPVAQLSDYLPAGQQGLAWRYQVPVTDLTSLGAAMAADPAISECAVARAWNWAIGRGDIVATLSTVPSEVIQQQVTDFVAGNHSYKDLLQKVFTSDDFTKY